MLKRSKADIPLGTETIDVDLEDEAVHQNKNRLLPATAKDEILLGRKVLRREAMAKRDPPSLYQNKR